MLWHCTLEPVSHLVTSAQPVILLQSNLSPTSFAFIDDPAWGYKTKNYLNLSADVIFFKKKSFPFYNLLLNPWGFLSVNVS